MDIENEDLKRAVLKAEIKHGDVVLRVLARLDADPDFRDAMVAAVMTKDPKAISAAQEAGGARAHLSGKAQAFLDTMDVTGFIGLQVHGIKKGTGPYEVRWRNIKIIGLSKKK